MSGFSSEVGVHARGEKLLIYACSRKAQREREREGKDYRTNARAHTDGDISSKLSPGAERRDN